MGFLMRRFGNKSISKNFFLDVDKLEMSVAFLQNSSQLSEKKHCLKKKPYSHSKK